MLPPTFIQQQGEPWWENTIASTTHSSIPQASTYCPQCCGGEVGVLGWGWETLVKTSDPVLVHGL